MAKITKNEVGMVNPEFRMMSNRIGLFNSHFQNFKQFGIPKAQLIIADVPYCYDTETECWTTNGWKKYNELSDADTVLSLNPTNMEMEYSGIERIIIRRNTEDMYQFKSNSIDLFVTANHRMFTHRCYNTKTFGGKYIRKIKTGTGITLAKDITAAHYLPRSGYLWEGKIEKPFVEIPPCYIGTDGQEHIEPAVRIPLENWLPFFGLWLADGCWSNSHAKSGRQLYTVSVKQYGEKRAVVEKIMGKLPFRIHRHDEKGKPSTNFNIYSKQLWSYLQQFGKAKDKFIPQWILDLPTDYLRFFWDGYTFGDSCKNGNGIKISSVSRRLIEGLQQVALRLGCICQIREGSYEKWKSPLFYFQYNPKSRNIKYCGKEKVSGFNGVVWCITLKRNSVFLVRRNGKIAFCGNCIGKNAYASNPTWYVDGDNKNGESELAGTEFFDTDKNFRPAEFMHFCSQMLRPEPKQKNSAPCMVLFCEYEQQFMFIELGKRYGINHYIPLVFRKNYSAQVLKANMKIVGNCEYGLVLYRDKLPKFRNNGKMVFNCIDYPRQLGMRQTHPTQKPLSLLSGLISLFTDVDDVVIDPCAGSGSTIVAAASLGRKAYGFEIKKNFYLDAVENIKHSVQLDMFNIPSNLRYKEKEMFPASNN